MSFVILFMGIILLVVLITWAKLNPFLAFIIVSVLIGLANGKNISVITTAIQKGMGDLLGSIVVILGLGAMLGKLIADSGAAQKIATGLMDIFGKKYIMWALLLTGFIIGIPLFYGAGFVLVVPLIITLSYRFNISAVYIGLPMLAALSVTHGFLPPHPSPTGLVNAFHADMGKTLLYGITLAIPAIIIAGPLLARTLKNINSQPLATFRAEELPDDKLPSAFNSFFTALLPVMLLMGTTIYLNLDHSQGAVHRLVAFIGNAPIVMLISLIVATFTMGIIQGLDMKHIGHHCSHAVKDVSLILLIVAGSGAFKAVLTDSGAAKDIADMFQSFHMQPLLLGWLIAAIIRISLGSATVAGLTTAGILSSMVLHDPSINPNLMVLAIGAGSLTCSHLNDGGFWLFKEYFNLSIKDTLRSWTVMETTVSVIGITGVLILNTVIS